MTQAEYSVLKERIYALADSAYLTFHQKLVPDVHNLIGVRVPVLRKLAREISKGDWRGYLAAASEDTYEEVMLQGMVLGCAKMEIAELLERLVVFVPKIDNWAVCDVCVGGLKAVARNQQTVLDFLTPYLCSTQEFEVRFAVVTLMTYYIDEQKIENVLELLDGVKHQGYYVKMAVAWAVSVCFVKFQNQTMRYLCENTLDDFTYHKALQKITESNRVSTQMKAAIRGMKRKREIPE